MPLRWTRDSLTGSCSPRTLDPPIRLLALRLRINWGSRGSPLQRRAPALDLNSTSTKQPAPAVSARFAVALAVLFHEPIKAGGQSSEALTPDLSSVTFDGDGHATRLEVLVVAPRRNGRATMFGGRISQREEGQI